MSNKNATRSFISYEDRIKRDEEELEALIAGGEAETETPEPEQEQEVTVEEVEDDNLSDEEKSFKKRYGDLRKHLAKKTKEFEDRLKELESSSTNQSEIPVDPAEVEAWIEENPQVAKIVKDLAKKIAEDEVKDIREQRETTNRNTLLEDIRKVHKDFDDLSQSDEFHDWVEAQPKVLQDAVYENNTDAKAVIRVLDLYKADLKKPKDKKQTEKNAASLIGTKTRSTPDLEAGKYVFTESQIQKMTMHEYAEREDEINKAIRDRKVLYDLSGGAR